VNVPDREVKLFPGEAGVSVPGPTKDSRLTRDKAAWHPRHEIMKKIKVSFFMCKNTIVQKDGS
jgi:hypothetical protein